MYTGTLIKDLMARWSEPSGALYKSRSPNERELQRMFDLQIPLMQHSERIYAGAA